MQVSESDNTDTLGIIVSVILAIIGGAIRLRRKLLLKLISDILLLVYISKLCKHPYYKPKIKYEWVVTILIGTKNPLEYEVLAGCRESHLENYQWYTVRLKNLKDEVLTELEVGLHLINSQGQENVDWQFFGSLVPNESKTLSLLVQASDVAHAYLSVSGQENNRIFHWSNEVGEVVDKKSITQETIEAKIAELKEQYARKADAFDKQCEKNQKYVDEWMTGHEPVNEG